MTRTTLGGLLISSMLSPFALAAPALAQAAASPGGSVTAATDETPDAPADSEIVVTGIRRSLEAARDIKRDAVTIVDAIVADDIGKLPDRNVAESLARVSGVQVDRGIGEGTSVSVRGLRQNVFLLNGREIVDATGRGGAGLDQLGTSTYGLLALVPSELINRLEVTKLPVANQIAGALGGIVDVQTRRPLDGPDLQIAGRANVTYEELAKKAGYELFSLASGRFDEGRLGILLSASYGSRNLSQQGLDTFSGYARFTDTSVTPAQVRFGNADARPQDIREQRDKLGLDGVIQWRPREGVEIIADSFYSRLTSDRDRHWLSFNPTQGLSNATYSPNNILLSGRATSPVLTNTEFAKVEADIWSSALRGNFELSDRVKASAEVSYGRSTSSYRQIYFRLQPLASIATTVDFDLTKGPFGNFAVNGIDLTNPAQLRFTILFDQLFTAKTDAFAARSDWSFDLGDGFLRGFDAGVRYNKLDSDQAPSRADIRPAGGIPATQLANYTTVYRSPSYLAGQFGALPNSFLAGGPAVTGCAAFTDQPSVSQNSQCLNPQATVNSLAGTFTIEERFIEAYGKVSFEADIAGALLSGNVGVRYLDRDLTSVGNQINASGAATPASFGRRDRDWLPSAVLKLDLTNNLIVRGGASRVIAYPNTADLNNGLTLNNNAVFTNGVQTSPGTGSGGAPDLDAFKADQFDLSAEYYFGKQALLSVGLFYKDVSSFIIQRQSAESYAGIDYLINRKVNGQGAKVKGIEALVQLPFYFLPAPFDGFGLLATYSYIDSKTPIRDVAGRNLPFPGLSRNNVNLVGYYEKGPVSLRLAYNWRDRYLLGLSAAATGIYNDNYTDLSATFRYDLSPNVSLTLEANNLTDAKQRTFDGVREALRTNLVFGRIYKAGIGVKF